MKDHVEDSSSTKVHPLPENKDVSFLNLVLKIVFLNFFIGQDQDQIVVIEWQCASTNVFNVYSSSSALILFCLRFYVRFVCAVSDILCTIKDSVSTARERGKSG